MTKYIVAALAAVAVVLGLVVWGQQGHQKALQAANEARAIATQRDTLKNALEAANRLRAEEAQATAKRLAAEQARRKRAEAENKELRDALKDNPGWASQPVPDSVWRAIEGGAGGGAREGGAPGPAPAGLPDPGADGR